MTLMNSNHVVRLVVRGSAFDQEIVNVLHYIPVLRPSTPTNFVSQYSQCLSLFEAEWRTNILPLLNSFYTVHLIQMRVIEGKAPILGAIPPGKPVARYVYGDGIDRDFVPPNVGGDIGESSPTFVAVTGRKITGRAGKNWKGSIRLGPISEAKTISNDAASALITAADTGLDNIRSIGPMVVAGNEFLDMVVFSEQQYLYANAFPEGIPSQASVVVQEITINPNLGSQVSRKPRRAAF